MLECILVYFESYYIVKKLLKMFERDVVEVIDFTASDVGDTSMDALKRFKFKFKVFCDDVKDFEVCVVCFKCYFLMFKDIVNEFSVLGDDV